MTQPGSVRLPIAKVIAGALILAWERRFALWNALWLPILLGVVFTISETLWGPSSWDKSLPGEAANRQGALFLWTFPLFLLTVVFAVRSYRVYLLDDEAMRGKLAFSWGLAETRFMFAMAGIAFLVAIAAVMCVSIASTVWPGIGSYAGGRFGLLMIIPPAYIAGRLLLAFPALAVEDSVDVLTALGISWAISKHNGVRVFILCVIGPGAIAWLLGQLSTLTIPGSALFASLAVWLVMPIELAVVALSYSTLKRANPLPMPG